jgi:hypothetical protein
MCYYLTKVLAFILFCSLRSQKGEDVFRFRALPEIETPFLSLARAKRVRKGLNRYFYFPFNLSTNQLVIFSFCSGYVQCPVSRAKNKSLGAVITL